MNLLQHIIEWVSMFEDAKKAIHQLQCFTLEIYKIAHFKVKY